jgi:hypothetical protein
VDEDVGLPANNPDRMTFGLPAVTAPVLLAGAALLAGAGLTSDTAGQICGVIAGALLLLAAGWAARAAGTRPPQRRRRRNQRPVADDPGRDLGSGRLSRTAGVRSCSTCRIEGACTSAAMINTVRTAAAPAT